jgi:hypothetical protein
MIRGHLNPHPNSTTLTDVTQPIPFQLEVRPE